MIDRWSQAVEKQIQKYVGRISGTLLDRIDIYVEVQSVKYAELSSKRSGEKSSVIRQRVVEARQRQEVSRISNSET